MDIQLNINIINACYTCFKCAGICPTGLRPVTFVKAYLSFRYGLSGNMFEELVKDPSIWYCTKCLKCTEVCPQKLPLHEVIEYLQHKAAERGFIPQAYLSMINNVINTSLAFTSQTIVSREGDFFTTEDVISLFKLPSIPKIEEPKKFKEILKRMIEYEHQ